MAVKAVIFDIGGVVVHADLERYAGMAAARFKATEEDLRLQVQTHIGKLETGELSSDNFWLEVSEGLVKQGKGQSVPPARFKGLWKIVMADTMKVNEQLISYCRELRKRGVIVAALSNTIPEHADHLAQMGLYNHFTPCILSCVVGMKKPDKAIYLHAAKKIGKAPKECLFIDDSMTNVDGAKAAGMPAHYYTDNKALLNELHTHKLLD
jgi:epoxide hydrolase-like predicted phosphatase